MPTAREIAKGGVDPDDDKRMAITDVPELAPGAYTVKSTTKSAEDGDIDRKEWSFTVVAAPTPSPSPQPESLAKPDTATPVRPRRPRLPRPARARPRPTTSPSATAAPSPTPSADGSDASSGGDVLLPIIAAVVIVAAIAGVPLQPPRPPSPTADMTRGRQRRLSVTRVGSLVGRRPGGIGRAAGDRPRARA